MKGCQSAYIETKGVQEQWQMQIYVVKEGDNVDRIASFMGIPVDVLLYDNQIQYPYRLAVGQALFIRGGREGQRTPLYVS